MFALKLKSNKWNLVAGIIMILFGGVIWFNPFETMMALAFYIGLIFVVVGGAYAMASFNMKSGWYLLVGILDILIGLILMTNLGVSAMTLPVILALWCLTVGDIQFIGAFENKKFGYPWGWSVIMGSLGVVFGFLILAYPAVGMVAISTFLGLYAVLFGIFQLIEYYMSRKVWVMVESN